VQEVFIHCDVILLKTGDASKLANKLSYSSRSSPPLQVVEKNRDRALEKNDGPDNPSDYSWSHF